MTVSIIIPLKKPNKNLDECISCCLKLSYPDFEIIILPDQHFEYNHPKVKIIPTGDVTPPVKRDKALEFAKGEIIAFLDDDAYPRHDWLTNALPHFDDSKIAAVCGPAVTPESDSIRAIGSGLVYSSVIVGGNYAYRYIPGVKKYVDDYPSCNFIIRKSIMSELGGFNTRYWPGEDTFLCYKIAQNLQKKIFYDPDVLVWHHRRQLFLPHLRQIASYALHRGYFVKKYPDNSFKLSYFLPSILFLGICMGVLLSIFAEGFRVVYLIALFTYLIVVSGVTLYTLIKMKKRDMRLINLVFWGIILTHFNYGIFFIKGLFAKKMPEE